MELFPKPECMNCSVNETDCLIIPVAQPENISNVESETRTNRGLLRNKLWKDTVQAVVPS